MTKGQGALEYLMTYGWALLVIVVVGAALFALGVLNPSTYTQQGCRGFNYFQYQDQQMNTSAFRIVVLNGPTSATITNLAVLSPGNGDLGVLNITDENGVQIFGPVSQGQRVVIKGTSAPTPLSAGSPFTYSVRIVYDKGALTGNTDLATCSGRVQ